MNKEAWAFNQTPLVRRSFFLVCLFLLMAFALRLYALEAQSIWWDEGISLHLARSPLAFILADRLDNIHPPLYFILLKGWMTLADLRGAGHPTVYAFGGRYFSVLASLLQVALVYAVCRRWFRQPNVVSQGLPLSSAGPLMAAFLVTIAPVSVIYAQETRVYALLPLASLVLLALAWAMRDWQMGKHGRTPISKVYWLLLGLVEWVGLHLHYVMLFPVVYVIVWLLLTWLRERQWAALRRFWGVQVAVGIASLPWFVAVLRNWTAVQREANAGTYLAEPAPFDFLLKQVWVFHHTGLTGALAQPGVWVLCALLLLVTAVLVLLALIAGRSPLTIHRSRITMRLLLQWLLPIGGALLVWTVRSFSHPRYIAFAAITFIPLAAYLTAPGVRAQKRMFRVTERVLALILFLVMVILSGVGLTLYFFDPQMAKDDMRGAANYLAETLSTDDLIMAPEAGWAFPLEYAGHTAVVMPELSDPDGLWLRLDEWTAVPGRRIALVSAASGLAEAPAVLRFALERAGSLVETRPFDGLVVRIYEVNQPADPWDWTPIDSWFGPLQLTGAWVEKEVAADTAVTLALRWQLHQPLADRDTAVLQLLTPEGLPLAQWDEDLVDGDGRPTDLWSAGQVVTTTHVLPLPWGTQPQPVTLRLGVNGRAVDGRQPDGTIRPVEVRNAAGQPGGLAINLPAAISLQPAHQPGGNPYNLPPGIPRLAEPLVVLDGLQVTAVGLDRTQVNSGQTLHVALEWQATQAPLAVAQPLLQLEKEGQVLAELPVTVPYPLNQWRAGEVVLEHSLLPIPATAEAGTARLILTINGQQFPIGQVEIVTAVHDFAPPSPEMTLDASFGEVARLTGFDLPQTTVTAGEPIPLTLYWQAMGENMPVAYTVFAHLLAADGRLIGQHDAPPTNGTRPTTGWVTGEYITDGHEITFREPGYAGSAQIAVGLYDPATGTRLTLANGADALVLPITLMVEAGP